MRCSRRYPKRSVGPSCRFVDLCNPLCNTGVSVLDGEQHGLTVKRGRDSWPGRMAATCAVAPQWLSCSPLKTD